jgi:SAM-dependent MidA family methyltransferase
MQKLNPTPNNKLSLPIPDEHALSASQALQSIIHQEIVSQGGVIPFSRYMELALYAPQYGYYSGGATKLGRDGDFTTAPEMTSLFGASIAQFAQQLFTQIPREIMEFGAGTGKLAFDILIECQQSNIQIERYFIVELSGELRARQEELLKDFPQVIWLPGIPDEFAGLVIGNEVLDAMPVELIMKAESGWMRLGVRNTQEEKAHFSLTTMDAEHAFAEKIAEQIPEADSLPIGYITEVHPVGIAFMHSVSQMLLAGQAGSGRGSVAMWFDYGFPAHEYYLSQRDKGTLMCHYRHHSHPDPFYLPGLQDITAHIDFTAMARTAISSGLELLAYTSQAGFLLSSGITRILNRIPVEEVRRYLPASNALQKLISPAEMGELFKVLVLGCGVEMPDEFLHHDRSHRL